MVQGTLQSHLHLRGVKLLNGDLCNISHGVLDKAYHITANTIEENLNFISWNSSSLLLIKLKYFSYFLLISFQDLFT